MTDYETDVTEWSEQQAALLRRRAAGEPVNEADLDWPNIADEIEALVKSHDRQLASRINAVILHLMKLQASPAVEPRAGWRDTIVEQRDEIELLLTDAPSRRQRVKGIILAETPKARRRAAMALPDHGEQPLTDLDLILYTEAQVLGPWLP